MRRTAKSPRFCNQPRIGVLPFPPRSPSPGTSGSCPSTPKRMLQAYRSGRHVYLPDSPQTNGSLDHPDGLFTRCFRPGICERSLGGGEVRTAMVAVATISVGACRCTPGHAGSWACIYTPLRPTDRGPRSQFVERRLLCHAYLGGELVEWGFAAADFVAIVVEHEEEANDEDEDGEGDHRADHRHRRELRGWPARTRQHAPVLLVDIDRKDDRQEEKREQTPLPRRLIAHPQRDQQGEEASD